MIIWRKSKNMLHGYRQFYCLHKNIYKDIARDVETRFDIWIKQTIIKEKSINVVGLMIDELGGNIMK